MDPTRFDAPRRLPLTTWCFVLLGVPTFCVTFAVLTFWTWGISGILAEDLSAPPDWMQRVLESAALVSAVIWPVYIAWVAVSRRLSWREKGLWLFILLFFNLAAMPVFYVFMLRRYLGLEGRITPRDRAALDHFLARRGIDRERLTSEQLSVLKSYCRTQRLARLSILPMFFVAVLCLHGGLVFIPRTCIRVFADSPSALAPTHTIIVNSATGERREFLPNPEHKKDYVLLMLMLGATSGAMGTAGLIGLALGIQQIVPNRHTRAFAAFLKATGTLVSGEVGQSEA